MTVREPAFMHVVLGSGLRDSYRPGDFMAYYRRVRQRFLEFVADLTATHALAVGRVRAQLPVDGRPLASHALAEACSALERDDAVQLRLASLLLADRLGPARLLQLAA